MFWVRAGRDDAGRIVGKQRMTVNRLGKWNIEIGEVDDATSDGLSSGDVSNRSGQVITA